MNLPPYTRQDNKRANIQDNKRANIQDNKRANIQLVIKLLVLSSFLLCMIIIPIILFNNELNEWDKNVIELKCNIINWRQIKYPYTNEYYIMEYYYNKDNYTELHVSPVYNMKNFIPDTLIKQTCYTLQSWSSASARDVNGGNLRFSKLDLFLDRECYLFLITVSSILILVPITLVWALFL